MGWLVCLFVCCDTALRGHGRTGAGTREEERMPYSSSPRLCSLSLDVVIPMRHRHFQKPGGGDSNTICTSPLGSL